MPTAQTCAISYDGGDTYQGIRIVKVTWDWTSTDAGAVVAAGGAGVGSLTGRKFTGYLASFHTAPGSPTPSSYTITLYDDDDAPIATKAGASVTLPAENHTAGRDLLKTQLNIVISGAGDAKAGSAWAYIRTV